MSQKEQEQLKTSIWAAVLRSVSVHSNHVKDIKEIKKNTLTKTLFPTITYKDEEANRFGIALMNILFHLNNAYKTDIKIDYKPRTEFEVFQTMEEIHRYFYEKVLEKLS